MAVHLRITNDMNTASCARHAVTNNPTVFHSSNPSRMNPATTTRTGSAARTMCLSWGDMTRNIGSLDRRIGRRSAGHDERDHPTSSSSFNSFGQARVLRRETRLGDSRVVPLLDPLCVGGCSAGVPFVAGIELHGDGALAAPPPPLDEGGFGDVYELRFVLDGRGVLRYADDSGRGGDERSRETVVETGDAILMRHGVARLDGLRAPGDDRCSMATFVTYMPRRLLERDSAHASTLADFSPFGARHLWGNPSGVVESSCKLSDVMDKRAFDGLLSGATLWIDRSVDDVEGPLSASDSIDDVEALFSTPDSYVAQDVEIKDVYHTQIASSTTYELPNQTNRLALLFDPFADTPVPFVFGVEIFEPGHRTTPHVHESAYEMFFILSGEGEGFCNGERFALTAGDVVAFHPGSEHGIDNGTRSKMYCIEVMMPDEEFAQFVRAGRLDALGREELCILQRVGCQ